MAPCVSGRLAAAGRSSLSVVIETAFMEWPSAPTDLAWPRPPPTALSGSGRQNRSMSLSRGTDSLATKTYPQKDLSLSRKLNRLHRG
jgi:hypothetical protein